MIFSPPESAHEPPTGDEAGQNRSAQPIQQLTKHNQRVQTDKNGRFQNNRQGYGSPNTECETQIRENAGAEKANTEAYKQGKQTGNADGCEKVEKNPRNITARPFRSPRFGRFPLEAMEDKAHPHPRGEDRQHTCDQARPYGNTQRIHSTNRRGQ